MEYAHMLPARFIDRPNRFIAHGELNRQIITCHVKNTGRCRELLIPGCRIWVQHVPAPGRKTEYDLIAVEKGSRFINMDAAAPNQVFAEYVAQGRFLQPWALVRPETKHGDSRFDFYMEDGPRRLFAEVKGVTLEEGGIVRFPDAPTQRGVKHLHGLMECVRQGYEAWAVFVVQMADVTRMEPNAPAHPAFAEALRQAALSGVNLLALTCNAQPEGLSISHAVPVNLL